MSKIGVIGGTGFKESDEFQFKSRIDEHTPWGSPSSPLYKGKINDTEVYLLLRHGEDHDIPPHKINHRANIYALQREVEDIIGISSGGALNEEIEIPSISIPKDYVNFWNVHTFFDEKINHVTPDLSKKLREGLASASKKTDIQVRENDVYVLTQGPRLETEAEVEILKDYGDIVGMTMCPEATLCKETGVEYASITTIDNYAHGIGPKKVDYEEIVKTARDNWQNVMKLLTSFLRDR